MNAAGSGATDLAFPRFSDLTFNAEGGGLPKAWRPYWPGGVSGVTLGPGYDMKERSAEEVRAELVAAGVPASDATRLSAAAGLGAQAAADWVKRHRNAYHPITLDVSMRLFLNVYPAYYGRARAKVKEWGGSWDSLSPRMQEALIDLSFRGDFAKRHRSRLLPAIVASSETMLREALGDYDYWQSHTNLPPGKNGPNGRIVARAVFMGSAPPARAPASGVRPMAPVGASPTGAGGSHAIVVPVLIRVAVLDSATGQPVPYAEFDRVEIDGSSYQHPKLLRNRRGFAMTDAHGSLVLPIESKVAARGFHLRLGLSESAVVAEASWSALETTPAEQLVFREPLASGPPTGLRGGIRPIWLGGQSTAPGNPAWGWSARRPGVTIPDASLPKFEKWLDWKVPGTSSSPGAWTSIARASRPFSIHHENPGEAEIVLFALRFCPPVQQRPPSRAKWVIAGSHGKVPQSISDLDPHEAMFMCTRYNAPPKVLSGGRDFGTFAVPTASSDAGTRVRDDGTWKPHKGIDVAAVNGVSPVFAVAGGPVRLNGKIGGYGRVIAQRIDPDGFHAIYAHLHDQPTLSIGTTLRAGQLIGKAGRTESAEGAPAKSYPNNSPTHLHFEICHGTLALNDLRIEPSSWFANHRLTVVPSPLPSNEMLRLFPCDCETPDGIAEKCSNRGGTSHAAASECWAARSGACPYGAVACPRCAAPVTAEQITALFHSAGSGRAQEFATAFNDAFVKFEVNTCLRKAHFFAQVMEEVGPSIEAHTENLNYHVDALKALFSYFKEHPDEAHKYGRTPKDPPQWKGPDGHKADPVAIANRAYALRVGNGDIASGDGWRFRGGGSLQLTGRANYTAAQAEIDQKCPGSGVHIMTGADSIATPKAVLLTGLAFWSMNKLNQKADHGATDAAVDAVTTVVNLHTTTYAKRRAHFNQAKVVFEVGSCTKQ